MARWAEVRAELDALLALAPDERGPHLDELARRDADLADEVRALLAHDAAAGDAFLAADPHPWEPGREVLRDVGPYELLRELGRGGMGVVYLARRADGAYQRRVAVKLLQRGAGDAGVLERFRRERQVLANLEHPGIARLVDGGTAADGTPYLVMEYVEGVPVDAWADTEGLSVRARLELFLEVCEAVQHAHDNLVVHRDLKPRNVLVAADGRVKLLDFGIAKVLDPEKTSAAPDLTVGFGRFLTPAYASPELVAGRPVTTSSDVYSLGVLLFELLTGEPPYRVETTSAAEVERIVCDTVPLRPSAAARAADDPARVARLRGTTPRGLVRALAGDLDRIVGMALRKEPGQRYASVRHLAEDVRRHLQGRPVAARGEGLAYRASRLARRNRAVVSTAALVLVALVAGLVTSLSLYRGAEEARAAEREQRGLAERRLAESRRLADDLAEQRRAAEQRLAEVERLNEDLEAQRALAQRRSMQVSDLSLRLIQDVNRRLYAIAGTTEVREVLVTMGLSYLDGLAAESGHDPETRLRLAKAYMQISGVLAAFGGPNLGRLDEALAAAARAEELAQELHDEDPDDVRRAALLAQVRGVLGSHLRSAGRVEEAAAAYRAGLEVGAPLAEDPAATVDQLGVLGAIHGQLAELLDGNGLLAESRPHLLASAALLERQVAIAPGPDRESELLLVRALLANNDALSGRPEDAVAPLQESVQGLEALARQHPDHPVLARKAEVARNWCANALSATGRVEEAAAMLRRTVAAVEARMEVDPADVQLHLDLLFARRYLMRLLFVQGEYEEFLELGLRTLEGARELARRRQGNAFGQTDLAGVLCDVGSGYARTGAYLEAVEHLTQAREILDGEVARDPSQLHVRRDLSRVHLELGRTHRAAAPPEGEARTRRLEAALDCFARALDVTDALVRDGLDRSQTYAAAIESAQAEVRAELDGPGGRPVEAGAGKP